MKDIKLQSIIKRVLLEEVDDKAFTKREVMFFKFLNEFKENANPTTSKLNKFIQSNMSAFGFKTEDYNELTNKYTQNYREDGRYEDTKTSELKQYHNLKSKKVTNTNASERVSELLPFKGSNLEGRWEQDGKGEWGYIVLSYGWYPIYIYKYKKWFETSGTYSSSTSKQMRNTRPTKWNSKLGKQMLICDRTEMEQIRKGSITPEQLVVDKNNKFTESIDKLIDSRTLQTIRVGWFPRLRISFYYTGVRFNEKMPEVTINVVKVDKIVDNKIDREAGDFFTDNMIGVTKEYLKDSVESYLERSFTEMLGRDLSENIMVNITYNK
jgi:hypothetical protein